MDQALDDVIAASRAKKPATSIRGGRGRGRGRGGVAQNVVRRPPPSAPAFPKPTALRITVKNDLVVPARGRGVVKPTQMRVQPRAAAPVCFFLNFSTSRYSVR